MTLEVKVTVPEDDIRANVGAAYLAQAMSAIGFARNVTLPLPAQTPAHAAPAQAQAAEAAHEAPAAEAPAAPLAARVYGQSEEGKARRNKDQMAEDKAIEELWGGDADSIPTDRPASDLLAGLKAGDVKPGISTGEERIDPTNPDDAAQDAEDEAAEVAATRGDAPTLDDLRHAIGAFQKTVGFAEAVERIPAILGCAPADVPEDKIVEMIAKVNAAAEASTPAPELTKADVLDALKAYARKYDGQDTDMSTMICTTEDRPKIFNAAFKGRIEGVSGLPDNDENGDLSLAIRAIREAIEKNPFNREVKG